MQIIFPPFFVILENFVIPPNEAFGGPMLIKADICEYNKIIFFILFLRFMLSVILDMKKQGQRIRKYENFC